MWRPRKQTIPTRRFRLISLPPQAPVDPDITPAAALFQVPRISRIRGVSQDQVRTLVQRHIQQREFDILGEPRVNVLGLNLALDEQMDN